MARQRDYKAEYQRRIARGQARGLSRSQARGHPRAGEPSASGRKAIPTYDRQLEEALKLVRSGKPVRAAARSVRRSPERLSVYITLSGVMEKQGGRWRPVQDDRLREIPIYSRGQERVIVVRGLEPARQIGLHRQTVGVFVDTNDPSVLSPFVGQSVTDITGERHVFETRPNILYRLTLTRGDSFEAIYRIVV